MILRPTWAAAVALTAGLVASSAEANVAERPFVGPAVAGLVQIRSPRQPTVYLAFIAEAQVSGTVRFRAMRCVDDECSTRTLTLSGTISLVGGRVELAADHPDLGHVALAGPTAYGGPGQDVCHATWGPAGQEPNEFAYAATGDNYRVNWSGRVGGKTARAAQGFVCGRYLSPGVIAVS